MASKKKQMINVDDLEAGAPVRVEEVEITNGIGGLPVMQSKGGLNSMVDRHKKQIFLFDISGSMGDGMVPNEIEQMYTWSDEGLEKVIEFMHGDCEQEFGRRNNVWSGDHADIEAEFKKQAVKQIEAQIEMDLDENEEDATDEELAKMAKAQFDQMTPNELKDLMFELTYGFAPLVSSDLKLYFVRNSLDRKYETDVKRTSFKATSMRKIDIMKKAASQFIGERFDKVPDAQVLAYQFDDVCELLTTDISKVGLIAATDKMMPRGGTNIFMAMDIALKEFKRLPSALGAHHIVLVTDAESGDGNVIKQRLLPIMKDLNVVLDFIQVKGKDSDQAWNTFCTDNVKILKEVCDATGGEFVVVNTPSDFETKLLKAANRLLLTAGNSKN